MKLKLILATLAAFGTMQVSSVYAEGEMGHGEMFKEADTNHDGKLSYDEFKAAHEKHMEERFKKMDTNGDGFVDETEMKAGHEEMREKMKEKMKEHRKNKMDDAAPVAK